MAEIAFDVVRYSPARKKPAVNKGGQAQNESGTLIGALIWIEESFRQKVKSKDCENKYANNPEECTHR